MTDSMPAKIRSATVVLKVFIIWLTAATIILGCGKKGPPEPPSGNKPPQVRDLGYSITGNTIKLSWTIPEVTENAKSAIAGFLIYRHQQPAYERECPGCPVSFKQVGDVPAHRAGSGESAAAPLVFTQTIELGYRYKYKVKAYDDRGIGSRDSNIVQFLF
jgi:hypothetical protein